MNAHVQQIAAQKLNHVEFVHRPGERALVCTFFDLMGFGVVEISGGRYLMGIIDEASPEQNFVAGCEVRPEQWAFDQALATALTQEPLASSYAQHRHRLAERPQDGMHFGIHFDTPERWEQAVARIATVDSDRPELAGRVRLERVFRPGDPDAFSIRQAFLWTDLIASGSLAFGQQIELQTTAD